MKNIEKRVHTYYLTSFERVLPEEDEQTLVDDDCNVRHNVVVHRVVFCDTVCMKRKFDKDYAYFILAVLILGLLIIVMTNCAAHK